MKTPNEVRKIGYWLNEIQQKTVAQACYDHAVEALQFFGPEVAWNLDPLQMHQTAMRKLSQ